jgi:epoxyqueuosine reductase
MGNALASPEIPESEKDVIRQSLQDALPLAQPLVAEHIEWALSSTHS